MSLAFDRAPSPQFLRDALGWLRDAQAVLTHSGAQVSTLSDKDLRDIGLKPRSLSSAVAREIGKSRLVDFGWRLGR